MRIEHLQNMRRNEFWASLLTLFEFACYSCSAIELGWIGLWKISHTIRYLLAAKIDFSRSSWKEINISSSPGR